MNTLSNKKMINKANECVQKVIERLNIFWETKKSSNCRNQKCSKLSFTQTIRILVLKQLQPV